MCVSNQLRVICAATAFLLPGLATLQPMVAAEIAWPAESLANATNLTHVEGPGENDFYVNLSGAFWNPDTRRLWLCRNGGTGGSKFWVLKEDGNGSFEIDYKAGLRGEWTNFGDLEAITQADYSENVVYLLIEGEERIKEFDVSVYGTAVLRNNWNTSPHLPLNGGSGAEGIVFVPDTFLSAQGFVDGNGNPYTSQNGMGGLMFVAHQNGGRIYAFDLNRSNGTFTFVGAYLTNYSESCELTFDRSDGRLYILHGANWNRIEVCTLGSTLVNGERRLNELFTYGRPSGSPGNWNLEGFAVFPNDDCVDGKRSAFLTIDDGGVESLLWYKDFPCNCDVDSDGDGIGDCDDACPSTPGGSNVDALGCACGQGSRTSPSITAHPVPTSLCNGQSTQLCVSATSTAPVTYQWQRNGANIAGANNSCYTATLTGNYRCIVTNDCGSVTSNVATLTVVNPVIISSQPTAATICAGQSNQFCVTATGTAPLSYQWQRDGTNILNATSSCYTATQAGAYRCIVSNSCGSQASNAVMLTVNTSPAVTAHPVAGTVCAGDTYSLCVTATGTGPLNYQWQRNSVNISNANAACYNATTTGTYRCIITNSCGQATSNSAVVSDGSAPTIISQPVSTVVCIGQSQQFCITATGSTPLTSQWQRNGVNIPGATSACYTATEAGTYRCVVSNACGSTPSNSATLSYYSPMTISAQPASTTICSGNTTQLCVVVAGGAPPTYQWQRNGVNIAGANSSCFSASVAGTYRCIVTDSCTVLTSTAAVVTVQASMLWYMDADMDGFGNPNLFTSGCTAPTGYVANNLDCDDNNPNIHPMANDVCGEDRNCDGLFETAVLWYKDADEDGFGDPFESLLACVQPPGYVSNAEDCNDENSHQFPGAPETCDGIDNNCDGLVDNDADSDEDGVWDCLDRCLGTPKYAQVSEDGCSCEQQNSPTDSDGDGVPDCADACPGTIPGAHVDSQGCSCIQTNMATDEDGDGVPDCLDRCPGTQRGLTVDADGCHCIQLDAADDDGDGVPNCFDACPFTPRNTPVGTNGCPDLPVFPNGGSGGISPEEPDEDFMIADGRVTVAAPVCGAGFASMSLLLAIASFGAAAHARRRRVIAGTRKHQ